VVDAGERAQDEVGTRPADSPVQRRGVRTDPAVAPIGAVRLQLDRRPHGVRRLDQAGLEERRQAGPSTQALGGDGPLQEPQADRVGLRIVGIPDGAQRGDRRVAGEARQSGLPEASADGFEGVVRRKQVGTEAIDVDGAEHGRSLPQPRAYLGILVP